MREEMIETLPSEAEVAKGGRNRKKFLWKLLRTAVLLVGLALILTWLLEWRYFEGGVSTTWTFCFERPLVFLFNSWLILLILVAVSALGGSIFHGAGVLMSVIWIVGYVHINKVTSRGTPLLPEDLQLVGQAAGLTKFVSIESLIVLAIAVIVTLVVFGRLERHFGKYFVTARAHKNPGEARFWRRKLFIPRVICLATAVILFLGCSEFIRHHTGEKYERIDFLDTTFTAWNQTKNYNDNGFLVGFLYNCAKLIVAEPEGYSEERIAEITEVAKSASADREAQAKPLVSSEKPSLAEADYNIVIVLNESFIDPAVIQNDYPFDGGDPTPNLHNLMVANPSGYMYSVDYGGGTANVEFEMLTGLTNYWLATVPYTNLIPHAGAVPSIASFARENGYAATAIHAYTGGMYRREVVLMNEGFEKFTTEVEYTHREHDGTSDYINDRSTYQEVLDQLAASEQKQLVFAITMQNHTPYNEGTYEELKFHLKSAPAGEKNRQQSLETYLQSLANSDAYLGEFLDELAKLDEKTVVLFFGDHAPGLLTELTDSEDAEEFARSRTTPYFIWNNFGAMPANGQQDLPRTTPNCLTNTLYDYLGIVKPATHYLLAEVCAETPILTPRYFGESGLTMNRTLEDYKLLTYDILAGKKYFTRD